MKKLVTKNDLIKISNYLYEIPATYREDMRVPAHIFVNEKMLDNILQDTSLDQMVNVATLPGIVQHALAMPDIHQGYGFPIGGVAATSIDHGGIISPGGIGYDINCGVRLLAASINADEIKPYLEDIATELYRTVPSGVGRGGPIKLSDKEFKKVLSNGAKYMVSAGYGNEDDLTHCEENGHMSEADADFISDKALKRGYDQLGTLGSGNHFLEIQKVTQIYDDSVAQVFGLKPNMVTVMIHCGSRGLGHQTCTDYVQKMVPKLESYGIVLPDRELACAPIHSPEGQDYYKAMAACANFAWANRHVIAHRVREAFTKFIGNEITLKTVYDLSHNIGKKEKHTINGIAQNLMLHRKGATRAFGPNRPEVPLAYRATGHPVLVPGTMGTSSYILVGTEIGMEKSFGSCCHGAGRSMSRIKAKKSVTGSNLRQELETMGIVVRCDSDAGLAEEAPIAYKDVDIVTDIIKNAGIAKPVAKVVPIAVIKGG